MPDNKENPKHIRAMKDGKDPLEYLITSVDAGDARTLRGGALKYGVRNWLIDKITASTYEGAIRRHFKDWSEGRDVDPDSGEHPFYHIRACCAIVLDAEKNGMLIDDRDRCESISQEKAAEVAPEDPEITWTVRYSTTQKTALNLPMTRSRCYGPFLTFEEAKEFATSNPRNQHGIASIDTILKT